MVNNQHIGRDPTDCLRERAEEITREMAAQFPEDVHALSLEEVRQVLHELRVYQTELELQNEELRQAQMELDVSRARYFNLYDLAPVGYCTVSEAGLILETNLTAAALLGETRHTLTQKPFTRFIHSEDQDIYYFFRNRLLKTGGQDTCELRMVKRDSTTFWAHLGATVRDADGARVSWMTITDITERKFREGEQAVLDHLILLVNTAADFHECLSHLSSFLQHWSGCEAVGIRLREGDDYPYYLTRGFPATFVRAESSLCAHDPDGNILRDEAGNPIHECMCGNILAGRFDPAKPFFTARGSFWTNSTTTLLATTTEADRQSRTRNRCNSEGYESVALVPLRTGDTVFGLLQFNDHRRDRFTHHRIADLEKLADNLALALSLRRAQEALLQSEEKYRTVADFTYDWEYWLAPDGSLPYVSPSCERHTGYRAEEFRQDPGLLTRIVHPDDRAPFIQHIHDGQEPSGKEHTWIDFRVITRGGEERWIAHACRPVFNRNGKYLGIRANNRDISIRKGAEFALQHAHDGLEHQVNARTAELEQANAALRAEMTERNLAEQALREMEEREKQEIQTRLLQKAESLSRMAGAIAHHFNNQLAVVMGNLEMAMADLPQSDAPLESLAEAMAGARKAAEVSSLMLTYLGQSTKKKVPLDISEICRQSLTPLRASLPATLFLETDLFPSGPTITGDLNQLQQILTHLIANAGEAITDGRGHIHLNIKTVSPKGIPRLHRYPIDWTPEDRAYACLEVSDDGCGIEKQDIEKIFDPFFTTKFPGRGLGLAVVLGISRTLNGAVTVESQPGRGSIFRVFLPLSTETVEYPSAKTAPGMGVSGKILLVEDQDAIRKIAVTMLTRLGFTVLESKNGLEAVEIFGRCREEILFVLSGLTMPQMNGWELVAALRALSPTVRIILSSGHDEEQVMATDRPERPNAFLHKPFSIKDMADAIRKVLAPR